MFRLTTICALFFLQYKAINAQVIESAKDTVEIFRNATESFQASLDEKSFDDMTQVVHQATADLRELCGTLNVTECRKAMKNVTNTAFNEFSAMNALKTLGGTDGMRTAVQVKMSHSEPMDRVFVDEILGYFARFPEDSLPSAMQNVLNAAWAVESIKDSFSSSVGTASAVMPNKGNVAIGSAAVALEAVKYYFTNDFRGNKERRNLRLRSDSDESSQRSLQYDVADREQGITMMINTIFGYATSDGDPLKAASFAFYTYAQEVLGLPMTKKKKHHGY